MWSINSPFPKNSNKSSYTFKSSFSENLKDNISNNLFGEISFKTPIKEINNIVENNNSPPFKSNFNYYLGNLYSPGPISINPINNNLFSTNMTSPNKNKLFSNNSKDNFLNKKLSESRPFKISPDSMEKDIGYNSNNRNYYLSTSERQKRISDEIINENELSKKNLCLLFNETKNDNSFYDDDEDKIFKSKLIIGEKENFMDNKNINFYYDSPIRLKNMHKKIFECSGSTLESFFSMPKNKKKRLRKNDKQLFLLKKFYSEHKHWNKSQIKEISSKIGIKENKVYKWLWDQRNKEVKNNKFIVNKKVEKKYK